MRQHVMYFAEWLVEGNYSVRLSRYNLQLVITAAAVVVKTGSINTKWLKQTGIRDLGSENPLLIHIY